jgi:anti-anti-sigma factor
MDSGGEMAVQVEGTNERRVLRVAGPLDIAHTAALRQALVEASDGCGAGRSTVVDLAGVTAVDLCGLQLLCSAHRTFAARGGGLSLQCRPAWFCQASTAAGFAAGTQTCGPRLCGDCLWRE